MHSPDDYGFDTILTHLGEDEKLHGAVTPPLFQNSLFLFERMEQLNAAMDPGSFTPPYGYSRLSNPTLDIAEQKIARLEGTDRCKLTGSGMAAISIAIMSVVKAGSHAVCVDTVYGPTRMFLDQYLAKFGVTVTFVDGSCPQDFIDACRPETSLIFLESPSSLLFRLQDLPAITAFARARGITTIIDNTYATPLRMRPAQMGVDIVCHSATKYLGGHSDLVAGAICTSEARMIDMMRNEVALYGSVLNPFGAWLIIRGLRTLSLRVDRHEATANLVARWIEAQPAVATVHHISLDSFPQRDLYLKTMSGSTGLFSFEPKTQDRDKIFAFVDALKLFGRGVSWGGFESLAIGHRASTGWIVRLFCGLEDPKDLLADLEQAMPLLGD